MLALFDIPRALAHRDTRGVIKLVADTWAPYLTMAEGIRIAAGQFRNQLPTSCCA